MTTVFYARKVRTMDPGRPTAQAVVVRDGRIVDLGTRQEVERRLSDSAFEIFDFGDRVLLPGFVDNHLHPFLGGMTLQAQFITPFDWNLPRGRVEGIQSRDAYLERLRELDAEMTDGSEPLLTWGHHPLFHGDVFRDDLDAISATRPIVVWARSAHEMRLNTPAIAMLGFSESDLPRHPQIDWDRGWAYETGLKTHVVPPIARLLLEPDRFQTALKELATIWHHGGVTTGADAAAGATDLELEWVGQKAVLDRSDIPVRLLFIPTASVASRYGGLEQAADLFERLPERNTHRLRWVKQVKLFADGAFYSQFMQMCDGYTDGHQGEWMMEPQDLEAAARVFWDRGWQIHVHVNGDLGMDATLNVLEKLLADNPRDDHRFALHHAGYFTADQAERMADLDALVSAQPYYLHALGEAYAENGLGPERAHYMSRFRTLLDNGVPLSLHSDFPMAPAEPLRLAAVAVNRQSASGSVLGPEERITVDEAMRAITIDAAHAIRLEDEVGSIEPGKAADFVVLESDPYEVPPTDLATIGIWGTVFEGAVFPVAP